MEFNINSFPSNRSEVDGFRIAEYDDSGSDGISGTYDERKFNDYRANVLEVAYALTGKIWDTEHDHDGVYLIEEEEY